MVQKDQKNQWEAQKGVCYFSGVNLVLSNYTKINKSIIYSASLDRLNSDLGYVKGNIIWVSKGINYMKNTMTEDETWEMCNLICDYINKKRAKQPSFVEVMGFDKFWTISSSF